MDAADHFALGEQALTNAGEALDAREANEFVAQATAHFTGGLLAWVLFGTVAGIDTTLADVQARHPFATVALVQALEKNRSSADATAEDPDETITHRKGVDA
jgi:hypothetical protein